MKTNEELSEMMTIQEVAILLNVSYHTVFKWIQKKELKAIRVGSKVWRIPRDNYIDFLKEE